MVEVFKVYAKDRVLQPHLSLLTLQLVLMTRMRCFDGVFRTFLRLKESASVTRQVSAGVVADTNSSELSAHQLARAGVAAH